MNEEEKCLLRKLDSKFMMELEPQYLIGYFQKKGIFEKETCQGFREIKFRGARVKRFMCLIQQHNCFTMEQFHQALQVNGYTFLSVFLNEQTKSIPIQRKAAFFSRFRKELVTYRHYLKRLCHVGDHETFQKEFYKAQNNWIKVKCTIASTKRYKTADTYFFALDAWCEYLRVIYDRSLIYSGIFDEIEDLKPYLSEENFPEMMRLVRYGSALLMSDNSCLDVALQYVNDAKSKFDLIHACRETGNVLYIEYNMLCQKYAKLPSPQLKDQLIYTAKLAIEHFSLETESDEMVYLDFRRMVLLKLSHLYLGIGMFGAYLNVTVSPLDIKTAQHLLSSVRTNDKGWKRMETRWKWSYYMAHGRLYSLLGQFKQAIESTRKALKFAKYGGYSREIEGSKDALKFHRRKYHLVLTQLQTNIDDTLSLEEQCEILLKKHKQSLAELKERVKQIKI